MTFATVVTICEGKFFLRFARHQEAGSGVDKSEFSPQSCTVGVHQASIDVVLSSARLPPSQPVEGWCHCVDVKKRSAPEKKIGT